MTTPVQTNSHYEPTEAQVARATSLRRFNWLTLYLPLGLAGLSILVLIGLLLWGTLSPNITGTREFMSGLADIVIILTILPLLVACALAPMAAIGFVIYRRQQPKREYGRLQPLFWRLDGMIGKAQNKAETALPKAANTVISGHSQMTYWRVLVNTLKKQFTRR